MPPRYKHSRPASSIAARKRPIARSSTAPPPPSTPAPPFEFASPEQQERYIRCWSILSRPFPVHRNYAQKP
ncbi:hypothetical protein JCGZ_11930 [Jatropha curcas]|uniref:Uncharacterized protein n=1 Tax=Jatropha curcas TaxID=180498 RepID=A0A067KRJ6_JATCU|nr:hypothetical protein JCGZ_11930 [Jatropha curcas]